jgi:hypothetical protein
MDEKDVRVKEGGGSGEGGAGAKVYVWPCEDDRRTIPKLQFDCAVTWQWLVLVPGRLCGRIICAAWIC